MGNAGHGYANCDYALTTVKYGTPCSLVNFSIPISMGIPVASTVSLSPASNLHVITHQSTDSKLLMLQSCIKYVLPIIRLHQLMMQAACAYMEIWVHVFFFLIQTDPNRLFSILKTPQTHLYLDGCLRASPLLKLCSR